MWRRGLFTHLLTSAVRYEASTRAKQWRPFAKVGRDQIHLVPKFSNVGGTRPTHGSHGVVAPMIWTWVRRFLLDPCLSPSRSQENFLRIANLINNFYFYASDISLLSYPAKVFVRWSERKSTDSNFQPEKMTSYCTKIVFIITYRAAIGLRLLPAGPTAANLCFRTTLCQLTCRTSDHPTFWF